MIKQDKMLFMGKKLILVTFGAVLTAFLFSGCGDKKEASKDNFKKVINNYYDKNDEQAVCFNLGSPNFMFGPNSVSVAYLYFGRAEFPDKVSKTDKRSYIKFYDDLVELGLLTKKEAKVQKSKSDKTLVDGLEYNLTNLGTNAFQNNAFCTGKQKVTEITQFTPPTNFMGVTGSQVNFKKIAVDIPNWALELVKKDSYKFNKTFKDLVTGEEIKDDTVLVLMNDGWITSEEFEKNMKK